MITRKHAILSNGLFPANDEVAKAMFKALDDYADARVLDFMQTVHGWGYLEKIVTADDKAKWRLYYENHDTINAAEYTTAELYRRYQQESQKKYLDEHGKAESI
jgi:hypothetical protein